MTKAQEESLRPCNPWVIDGRDKTDEELAIMQRLAAEDRQRIKKEMKDRKRGLNVISLSDYAARRNCTSIQSL